jgi:hypothetical protein
MAGAMVTLVGGGATKMCEKNKEIIVRIIT